MLLLPVVENITETEAGISTSLDAVSQPAIHQHPSSISRDADLWQGLAARLDADLDVVARFGDHLDPGHGVADNDTFRRLRGCRCGQCNCGRGRHKLDIHEGLPSISDGSLGHPVANDDLIFGHDFRSCTGKRPRQQKAPPDCSGGA